MSINRVWRAWWAVVTLPGFFAVVLPGGWVLLQGARPAGGASWLGLIPAGLGVVVMAECIRRFFVEGRGTVAPWDPPKHLIVHGMYRWVRNPMYVSVIGVLTGWAICFGSAVLAAYACGAVIVLHLRVVYLEEPCLRRRFGSRYEAYCRRVPRWIPGASPNSRGA